MYCSFIGRALSLSHTDTHTLFPLFFFSLLPTLSFFLSLFPSLSFSLSLSVYEPQQVIVLPRDGPSVKNIPLKFVKFQRIDHLTIFIEENTGGVDNTTLQHITLYGTTVEGTNMNELKKC